jgi:indole-3-glycerol phosphate synthase
MDNILEKLGEAAKKRVAAQKELVSEDEMREKAESIRSAEKAEHAPEEPFKKALAKDGISFICECKKASPSKGLIAPEFPFVDIARDYEKAGADAVSVLTEPEWFLGNDVYLREIADAVTIPCLRKDFTVDSYMIYQAKTLGASAVLLICAMLEQDTLEKYIGITEELGMSALVEAHDGDEIRKAVSAGAGIIGVNNRNLKNFTVDISNAEKLRDLVPPDIIFVAESGIRTGEDVRALEKAGADAVLVGETMMRAPDKTAMLESLRG